ncbi:putative sugar O-methyltransferase [Kibdelosporangium aridum]|uniref:putative sugar O-methyltransferase n=1 Tax=Kibdelosporangium aridum TaxID=2030 RepID=UPI000526918E
MAQKYQASRQWELINQFWVTDDAAIDLANFKSDRRNHKVSLWDPATNGVRYLKSLIYNLAARLGPDDWARLSRTSNREVGNPFAVKWEGQSVCLDYLQATIELGFIERNLDLRGANVLEIGAGYGRTCHTLLSNHDVAGYCIIDLKTTMELSRKYLRTVLDDEQFAKISWVTVDEVDIALSSRRFDLCVNIDSFAEMDPETVRGYQAQIDQTCTAFYTKNPVGKYLDGSLDGSSERSETVVSALETGLLRQVLDIHDSAAVRAAVPTFISAYQPGDKWRCVADEWAAPWSHYWQALYKKD